MFPVGAGHVVHHPAAVLPRAVRLGVAPQTALQEIQLIPEQPLDFILLPVTIKTA